MSQSNRRVFLTDVGRSMLAAGLGASLASDLGFSTAFANDGADDLQLGNYTPLVELMRSTPAEKLQPLLAQMLLDNETDLKQLVGAGALANAITFGGCDYVGFHTAMAMLPSLAMSRQLESKRSPLPVLKVLYRNAQQIQNLGGASTAALKELDSIEASEHASDEDLSLKIRDACRKVDVDLGESLLANVGDSALEALNALQPAVQDDLNVHRFVFAHRTYGLAKLMGKDFAYSLLRQCVRFCANHESNRIASNRAESPIRTLVPKLLDDYKLAGRELGSRNLDDEALDELSQTIYLASREDAAEAVAASLAEGVDPEVVGEAISLASNMYVLRQRDDKSRTHGDSPGVHSSDATNAWRNMARVAEPRHAITGLIVAAYHVGVQAPPYRSPFFPTDEHRDLISVDDSDRLLAEAEDAIRGNEQGRVSAAIQIYGERGFDVEPVFALMLKYAISEDGRLHGEKYYHTVREEYATIRPSFRWRQIVGLARVTASAYGYNREDEHGFRAAGYEQACQLLGVES